MFNIFKRKVTTLDKILLCAKDIIEQGDIVEDNASSTSIPHVKFKDTKGNTLYISWYASLGEVLAVRVNNEVVPDTHNTKILKMAKQRIQVLRKEHLERVVNGMKG